MSQRRAEREHVSTTSDNGRFQILCKTQERLFLFGIVKKSLSLTFVKNAVCLILPNILNSVSALLVSAARMLAMALAPLRRIVMRELDAYQPDPRNPKYFIYSLIDTLECGHSQDVYLFNGLLDVLNAYTDSPAVRARRHRCRPCASLLAKKKPQSVPLTAIAKAA